MVERRRVAKGWLAVSLLAVYACAGRSLERGDDDDAGATNGGSLSGRGGAGGSSSGRGGFAGSYQGKGGSGNGAFGGTILDGGSSGSGGFIGPTGGSAGSAGEPEPIGGGGGWDREPPLGGAGGRGEPFECENPRSADGGFVLCDSERGLPSLVAALGAVEYGYIHRPFAAACPVAPSQRRAANTRGEGGASSDDDETLATSGAPNDGGRPGSGNAGISCESDAECGDTSVCSATPLNYCDLYPEGGAGAGGGPATTCRAGCESDADCGTGYICLCGRLLTVAETTGACVPASCRTDADCEPGYRCASAYGDGYSLSFSCQTPEDECSTHDDCSHLEGGASAVSEECRSGSRRRCGIVSCGR